MSISSLKGKGFFEIESFSSLKGKKIFCLAVLDLGQSFDQSNKIYSEYVYKLCLFCHKEIYVQTSYKEILL